MAQLLGSLLIPVIFFVVIGFIKDAARKRLARDE